MAIIHRTTMTPTKLELLAAWLPGQPWYQGREPQPAKVGGFRLDDPDGAVGIEFMLVMDHGTVYQVPMTYRDRPLDGADDALIGTSEHGVLGRRWIYDGPRDPVLVAQLSALLQGKAEPQAQSISNTPDLTITVNPTTTIPDGPPGTDVRADADGGQFLIRVNRVLQPADDPNLPGLSAPWRLPDGTKARGILVLRVPEAS
jgi:Maltokinase N-terminal cap domain